MQTGKFPILLLFCDLSLQTEIAHKSDIQYYNKFYTNLGIEVYHYFVRMYRVSVAFVKFTAQYLSFAFQK